MSKRLLLAAIAVSVLISNGAYGDLKIANDPAQVGVGARSLGMGGVALNFTDISSLFGNPAALSKIKSTQYTFMHGKFINEVDYISVGGVIPSDWGNFGVAFLNSQLSYTGPVATTCRACSGIVVVQFLFFVWHSGCSITVDWPWSPP